MGISRGTVHPDYPDSLLYNAAFGGDAARAAAARMNALGAAGLPFFFVIDYKGREPLVLEPAEFAAAGLRARMPDLPGLFASEAGADVDSIEGSVEAARGTGGAGCAWSWQVRPVPRQRYMAAFDSVRRRQLAGDSWLANLCFASRIETDIPAAALLDMTDAPFRLWYPGRFVCLSPERFVRIADGRLSTCPMKGTIDAALPDAARRLLDDPKELAEHTTIVDLLRNDLGMACGQSQVDKFRYLQRIQAGGRELLATSSLISAALPDTWRECLGDLFFSLLPAGSVTGAPKRETVALLDEAEADERGFYTGVFGYFDGDRLDSAVAIRFLEYGEAGACWRSGGGITIFSDAEKEYEEVLQKIYRPAPKGRL